MNPLDIIAKGAKINPAATRVLFGVAVLAAVVALSRKLLGGDDVTALIGAIVVIVFAIIVYVVSRLSDVMTDLRSTIVWFVRFCLLLFVAVCTLIVSCAFFNQPKPLICVLRPFSPIECSRLAGNNLNSDAPAVSPSMEKARVDRERYIVYIQFAGFVRERVTALRETLKRNGWKDVPREERIGTAEGLFEVRYKAERDKIAASALAGEIAKAEISKREVKIRQIPIIAENTLEVWISQ